MSVQTQRLNVEYNSYSIKKKMAYTENDAEKAEILLRHFCSVFTNDPQDEIPNIPQIDIKETLYFGKIGEFYTLFRVFSFTRETRFLSNLPPFSADICTRVAPIYDGTNLYPSIWFAEITACGLDIQSQDSF